MTTEQVTPDRPEGCCEITITCQSGPRPLCRQRRSSLHEAFESIKDEIRPVCAGDTPWPLTLWGDTGSGKTCAGLVLIDLYGGEYWTTADWCERLRDAEFGRLQTSVGYSISVKEVRKEMEEANLFVLDEIGLRLNPSDHEVEEVCRVLDRRHNLPLVLISNYSPVDLGYRYGGQFTSRVRNGGTVVECKGDYRVKKRRPQ